MPVRKIVLTPSAADDISFNSYTGPTFIDWSGGSATLSYFSTNGSGGFADAAATFYVSYGVIESATLSFVVTGQDGTLTQTLYPTGTSSVPGTNPSVIVGTETSAVTQFPVTAQKSLATITAGDQQIGEIGNGPTLATVSVNTAATPESITLTPAQLMHLQTDANSSVDPYTVTFRLANDGLQSSYSSPGGGYVSSKEQVSDVQLTLVYADRPPTVTTNPSINVKNDGPTIIGHATPSLPLDQLEASLSSDQSFAQRSAVYFSDGDVIYQPSLITAANAGTDVLHYVVQDITSGAYIDVQQAITLVPGGPAPERQGNTLIQVPSIIEVKTDSGYSGQLSSDFSATSETFSLTSYVSGGHVPSQYATLAFVVPQTSIVSATLKFDTEAQTGALASAYPGSPTTSGTNPSLLLSVGSGAYPSQYLSSVTVANGLTHHDVQLTGDELTAVQVQSTTLNGLYSVGVQLGSDGIQSGSQTQGQSTETIENAKLVYTVRSTADIPCYCPGTLIQTSRGEMPVESLTIGDSVVTASGEHRPIKWIGYRSYAGRFLASNPKAQPIRFRAGSLGDCIPQRDLLVSPDHAVFLDGLLIPARCLMNGSTIMQERSLKRVDYYHVELDSHDVLLAEGAPCESFMDDDSRAMFHNAHNFVALYPNARRPAGFCARRVEQGAELEAIRWRLRTVADKIALSA